jgi:hypothetical protein
VLFDQGDMLAAIQAAVLNGFVVGAMALGLAAARFITERRWIVESRPIDPRAFRCDAGAVTFARREAQDENAT